MKFSTLHDPTTRDGRPLLVHEISEDGVTAEDISDIASSLRELMENWEKLRPSLMAKVHGATKKYPWDALHSPLPRAFQWADGSAFLHHVKLVRQARNAPMPENLFKTPLMYQGGSDSFLGPVDPIPFQDENFGLDFESEVAVVTGDVPMGVSAEKAIDYVQLIMIVNDVSLRGLIPDELAMGFGFFQSKPSSSFGPVAITPDELGSEWKDGRVHLPLVTHFNEKLFGKPNANQMHFGFGELIAHAARTRKLSAGTIIGSGTVSNDDESVGSSCLAEARMIETIKGGKPVTPFMKVGDRVRIEMRDANGKSLFGKIDQTVKSHPHK